MTDWLRIWAAHPDPDELVQVALYRHDGTLAGYVLATWTNGEWVSECGHYSWSSVVATPGYLMGLLWQRIPEAPDHAADIQGSGMRRVA